MQFREGRAGKTKKGGWHSRRAKSVMPGREVFCWLVTAPSNSKHLMAKRRWTCGQGCKPRANNWMDHGPRDGPTEQDANAHARAEWRTEGLERETIENDRTGGPKGDRANRESADRSAHAHTQRTGGMASGKLGEKDGQRRMAEGVGRRATEQTANGRPADRGARTHTRAHGGLKGGRVDGGPVDRGACTHTKWRVVIGQEGGEQRGQVAPPPPPLLPGVGEREGEWSEDRVGSASVRAAALL
jgi:hypothetical protein